MSIFPGVEVLFYVGFPPLSALFPLTYMNGTIITTINQSCMRRINQSNFRCQNNLSFTNSNCESHNKSQSKQKQYHKYYTAKFYEAHAALALLANFVYFFSSYFSRIGLLMCSNVYCYLLLYRRFCYNVTLHTIISFHSFGFIEPLFAFFLSFSLLLSTVFDFIRSLDNKNGG